MDDPRILKAISDCNPNLPLEPDDPRFVNVDDIRGFELRKRILRLLQAAETGQQFAKIAVAGHRGSGKSTELNRATAELRDQGYLTLWASVNENLDPKDISFSDIMRLIVQLLDDRFGDDPKLKESVSRGRNVVPGSDPKFSEKIQFAKELGLRTRVGGAAGAEGNAGILKFKTELGELERGHFGGAPERG